MDSICTIITKNHLAFAKTLCDSFLTYHPDGTVYVLIIDYYHGYIDPRKERFEIISIEKLDLPTDGFFSERNKGALELSVALKPFFFTYLLKNILVDKIIYFDADILITNRLDELYRKLENEDILLTPHIDESYPDDGKLPNDVGVLKVGLFNMGFIGIRKCENVLNFLQWWGKKVKTVCKHDLAEGYCGDQKYIDLAFIIFRNMTILYEKGYNVAYWNLHNRKVYLKNNEWYCNNGKLYFFHFSGYDPVSPNIISKFQSRYAVKDIQETCPLYEKYSDLLFKNGYLESNNWPYDNKSRMEKWLNKITSRLINILKDK